MRRFLFLLAPLGLAAFSFACEDDPSSNPSVNFPEAGTFDANRDPTDSGTPQQDAQPDAPAVPKGVTVIVTDHLGPKADIDVIFHDANGAVLEAKKTGADGKATSTPANATAMATAYLGGTNTRQLLTWVGVEDGDELPAVVPENATFAVGSVTIPGAANGDGGTPTYYAKIGGCRYSTFASDEPLLVYVDTSCYRGAGAFMLEARDDGASVGSLALGYSTKKPITLVTDGGTVPIDGLPAYAAPGSIAVQATGPANIMEGGFARIQEVANNTYFPSNENGYMINTGNGTTYEKTFAIAPATFTEAVIAAVSFETTTFNTRTIGKRAAPTGPIALDANALPPEITESSLDETNPKRPTAKWVGTPTGMKGGVIRISRFDPQADGSVAWTIVVPATGNQVTVPALPAALDNLVPAPDGGPSWDGPPEVIFADSNLLIGGYATFRKIQGAVLPSFESNAEVEDAVLPANGDFKITRYKQLLGR